jgi:FRG domain
MAYECRFPQDAIRELNDIHDYQEEGWIFRGQKDSEWGLRTSLERACKGFGRPLAEARYIEKRLLREFRRKYHHYAWHLPETDDSLEWLSLMQHYGAPTRLLDFTYSIYVATYFALENAEGEEDKKCAVWAINGDWAVRESGDLFKKGSVQRTFLRAQITEKSAKAFNRTFMGRTSKPLACPMNPFRLNERLTIQKGVFMCPGDVTQPFESNLCSLPNWDKKQNVVKLHISQNRRREFLDSLSDMNISRATLFPGLDGFAQ